jgi:hypothetical protein
MNRGDINRQTDQSDRLTFIYSQSERTRILNITNRIDWIVQKTESERLNRQTDQSDRLTFICSQSKELGY